MSEKEVLTEIEHKHLEELHYGCEVHIKNKRMDEVAHTHWFENIGVDGFYTTENQGQPARYISCNGIEWLDFEKLKPWLTMISKGK